MHRHALFFLALIAPFAAEAAAPPLIPVTGYLTDDTGAPVNASVALTLALYPDATSTTPLWSEIQAINVDNGQFTAYLGAQSPLALDRFRDNGTLYLGIAVGTAAEMTPRFHIATAPYAAYAQYADDAASVGGIDPGDLRLSADPVDWAEITPSTIPAGLADGDNDTTYTAGAGLTLDATTFAADQAVIEGWAKGVAYDTQSELRTELDGVYAAKQSCTTNQVLAADSTGAWVCTDATALPISETAVDNAVANNGYALASDLATTATALTALTTRVTTAEAKITANTAPAGVHDDVFQYNTTDDNAIPVQLKTQWRTNNGAMYRIKVEGYDYGGGVAINSECVGYLYSATDSIINGTCNNYAPGGVSLTQYKTSDGYLALQLAYPSSYYIGFTVSYLTLNPTGDKLTTFKPFKQSAPL